MRFLENSKTVFLPLKFAEDAPDHEARERDFQRASLVRPMIACGEKKKCASLVISTLDLVHRSRATDLRKKRSSLKCGKFLVRFRLDRTS